jgi:hypothetical protein
MKKIIVTTCEITGCQNFATAILNWQHQDSDYEQRILCEIHATAECDNWQQIGEREHFNPHIELRPIEPLDMVIYVPDHLVSEFAGAELLELTDRDWELIGKS